MGKYKVLDIFSFLPANVISLEQLEKMFLDSLSEISNNTKLGNDASKRHNSCPSDKGEPWDERIWSE